MNRSPDRLAEATLANLRIPRGELDDADAVEVLSTAITLRAARPGADQVSEEFVMRLRRLVAGELREVPTVAKLSRRAVIVASGVAIARITGAIVDRSILGPHRQISPGGIGGPEVAPDVGQWTAVMAESEITDGTIHRFVRPSVVGFIVNDGGSVWGLSGTCTHQGCLLRLNRTSRLPVPSRRLFARRDPALL